MNQKEAQARMQPQPILYRRETPADYREVENLTREAFWNRYAPGCDEHYLAHILRDCAAFVPELALVAVSQGRIVGSILYTRARILLDAGGALGVLTFGPLSVLPSHQRQGIGGQLIARTAAMAREAGEAAILIYGDPAYYARHGFVAAERYGIGTRDDLYRASLQAAELRLGALANAAGRFAEDGVFDLDPAESAAFDRLFPPRLKEEDNEFQRRFRDVLAMARPRR